MKKLPQSIKQIIKKKTFTLRDVQPQDNWSAGVRISYRITMVKAENEQHYAHLNPITDKWGYILVNLKVKGMVQMRAKWEDEKSLVEISEATKSTKNSWGCYDTKYDCIWGNQTNKNVRAFIRRRTQEEIQKFLKLFGISNERHDGGIVINKINWEK